MGFAQQHILVLTTLQQRMLQMYVVKTPKKPVTKCSKSQHFVTAINFCDLVPPQDTMSHKNSWVRGRTSALRWERNKSNHFISHI